jgi:leucyl aminopeptidase
LFCFHFFVINLKFII